MLFDVEEIASLINDHRKLSIKSVFLMMSLKVIDQRIKETGTYGNKGLKFLGTRKKGIEKSLKDLESKIKEKRKEIEDLVKKSNVKIKKIPILDALSDELKVKNDIPKIVWDQYYVFQIVKESFA